MSIKILVNSRKLLLNSAIALTICTAFSACDASGMQNSLNPLTVTSYQTATIDNNESNTQEEKIQATIKTIQTLRDLKINSKEEFYTIVEKYIDIDRDNLPSIYELSNLLPNELSSLTRIKEKLSSIKDEIKDQLKYPFSKHTSSLPLITNLKEELDALKSKFKQTLLDTPVDFTDALKLSGVTQLDKNIILLDGDQSLDRRELLDKIAILLLNAESRGQDVNSIVEAVNKNKKLQGATAFIGAKNGLYDNVKSPWPNGKVYYTWGHNMTPKIKEALLLAMTNWSSHTKLEFIEVNPVAKPIFLFFKTISENHITFMTKAFDDSTINGETQYIGIEPATGFTSLFFGTSNIVNIHEKYETIRLENSEFMHVVRHEIGHTLGLIHEHARTDRKGNVNLNNGITEDLPQKVYQWAQRWTWSGLESYKKGISASVYHTQYDCFSIMHYANKYTHTNNTSYLLSKSPLSQSCQNYKKQFNGIGDASINYTMNKQVSLLDFITINKIYK